MHTCGFLLLKDVGRDHNGESKERCSFLYVLLVRTPHHGCSLDYWLSSFHRIKNDFLGGVDEHK